MKADEAFKQAYKTFLENKIPSASLDAEVLLLEAINKKIKKPKDKVWLYVNYKTYELTPGMQNILTDFIDRRRRGEPVAYITGRKEFYGLEFFVNQNVLIPRPETELIVEQVLDMLKKYKRRFTLLDIGTGSGCIPISILKQKEAANKINEAFANDISKEAIEIARINSKHNGIYKKIKFINSDFAKAIRRISKEKNIIITANLPYISEKNYQKLKMGVKDFEPKIALVAPDKGLFLIKKMIENITATEIIFNNYFIFIEADPAQMIPLENLARKKIQDCQIEVFKDLRNKKRIMKISRK